MADVPPIRACTNIFAGPRLAPYSVISAPPDIGPNPGTIDVIVGVPANVNQVFPLTPASTELSVALTTDTEASPYPLYALGTTQRNVDNDDGCPAYPSTVCLAPNQDVPDDRWPFTPEISPPTNSHFADAV